MGTRRPDKFSTIYRGADGRWHGRVSMGLGSDGRRVRRHVSALDENTVIKKVRQLERERDRGGKGGRKKCPTVEEWLEHYVDVICVVEECRETTRDGYRSVIKAQIVPRIGHIRLNELTSVHIREMYTEMKAAKKKGGSVYSPGYVANAHRVLRAALNAAAKSREWIHEGNNPISEVGSPKPPKRRGKAYSKQECALLLDYVEPRRNGSRWVVGVALGPRQGEALGLRWDYVDLDSGTVHFAWTLKRRRAWHGCAEPDKKGEKQPTCGRKRANECPAKEGGGLTLRPVKSEESDRTLMLSRPLIDLLKAHRSVQNRERLAAGELWVQEEEGGFVWATETGRPIDPKRDWDEYKAVVKAVGLSDSRVHDLRHTAATLLLQEGAEARATAGFLGHSSTKVTTDTYQHVIAAVQADNAQRMENALFGGRDARTAGP